ncbi:uncharacterized protein [Leptinotarsa decemlineata]|uniref:uncharacterized protein n=1 Tax=Leptinotarsa decemlineata TaxID=7539 RepID=UPI000C25502F|nr:putative uncharacterized protein DDB_G0292438 [Leptinotarsa decemlineata]
MVHRVCMVTNCRNTSSTTRSKTFIRVPTDESKRRRWLQAARLNHEVLPANAKLFICEDHFDLPNDMENFTAWKTMGERLRLKEDVIPHKLLRTNAGSAARTNPRKTSVIKLNPIVESSSSTKTNVVTPTFTAVRPDGSVWYPDEKKKTISEIMKENIIKMSNAITGKTHNDNDTNNLNKTAAIDWNAILSRGLNEATSKTSNNKNDNNKTESKILSETSPKSLDKNTNENSNGNATAGIDTIIRKYFNELGTKNTSEDIGKCLKEKTRKRFKVSPENERKPDWSVTIEQVCKHCKSRKTLIPHKENTPPSLEVTICTCQPSTTDAKDSHFDSNGNGTGPSE